MNKRGNFCFGLLIALSLACSSSLVFATLPDWIVSPPHDDVHFFGIGEGRNKEQAKDVALKNILSQVNTNVSSSYQQSQVLNNDVFRENIKQQINSRVDDLPISQFKELNNHQQDGTFYTLISVTKQDLVAGFQREIAKNNTQIEQLIDKQRSSGSLLEWWYKHNQSLASAYATIARLASLLPQLGDDSSSYKKQLGALQTKFSGYSNDVCMFAKPHAQKGIQQALRENILRAGISPDNPHCAYTITLEESKEGRKLFGQHSVSLNAILTLFNKNMAIAQEQINETGTSVSSASMAERAAYQRLLTKIKNDDGKLLSDLLSP